MSRTYHHSQKFGKRSKGILGNWMNGSPGWWVHLFMTVPRRRADKNAVKRISTGALDPDEAALSVSARKPHKYYW